MAYLLALLLAVLSCTPVTHVQGTAVVHVWTPYETELVSVRTYQQPDPWHFVNLTANFSLVNDDTNGNSSGKPIIYSQPGFWDGGTTWRVRFSPPYAGNWSFVTSCSDTSNTGLHGRRGTFTAMPYVGTNPLYLHGIVRPDPSGRYFVHSDGTPFYWLGDTHWSGFSSAEHVNDTNNHTFPGGQMLRQMAEKRAAQGYSVWKAETFVVNGAQTGGHDSSSSVQNDGGPAWGAAGGKYVDLNPQFWAAIDRRVATVNAAGLLVSLAFAGIGRGLPRSTSAHDTPFIMSLARYAVARYAAYSTVWTTCQEYCTSNSDAEAWGRIAEVQWLLDPHKRSTSLHNCATNPPAPFRAENWYGHVTLQQGHGRTSPPSYWLSHYLREPARVVIEDEANYELLKYASMRSNNPGWQTRQSAWQSQVSGATGFTYGGQGIWWACYDENYVNCNCGDCQGPSREGFYTWYQALDFPVGGHQIPLMASFWRRLPWWTMTPAPSAIAWDHSTAPQSGSQIPFQKSDPFNNTIVAYLPGSDDPGGGITQVTFSSATTTTAAACRACKIPSYGGTVLNLNASVAHCARWFDPVTGIYTVAAHAPAGTTSMEIPAQRPHSERTATDRNDWVLLVTPTDDALDSVCESTLNQHPPKSTAHQAGIISTLSLPRGTSLITAVKSVGRVRTEGASVGCAFTANVTARVTSLCRAKAVPACNIQNITLWDTAAARSVASSFIDLSTAAIGTDEFVCAPVQSSSLHISGSSAVNASEPPQIKMGRDYVLVTTTDCADGWHDDVGTKVTVRAGASLNLHSVYGGSSGSGWIPGAGGLASCYGPLNLYYE